MDRNAPLKPHVQPGDGQKLREADAKTFFLQRSSRRVSGLPRHWTENGFRRGLDRARPGEVARTRRGPAVATRREADGGLLQGDAARHRRTLRPEFGEG